MALMQTDGVYRIVAYARKNPQNGLNISHWRVTSISLGTMTEDIAIAKFSALLAALQKNCMSSQAKFLGCSIQRIRPTAGSPVTTTNGTTDGAAGASVMSTQTAGVIQLRTDLAGRQNRGRKYIPFPSEEHNEPAGVPSALYLVALNGVGQFYADTLTLVDDITELVMKPVIWHPGTLTTTDVQRYTTSQNWGTQRRRSQINRPDAPPIL